MSYYLLRNIVSESRESSLDYSDVIKLTNKNLDPRINWFRLMFRENTVTPIDTYKVVLNKCHPEYLDIINDLCDLKTALIAESAMLGNKDATQILKILDYYSRHKQYLLVNFKEFLLSVRFDKDILLYLDMGLDVSTLLQYINTYSNTVLLSTKMRFERSLLGIHFGGLR